MDSRINKVLNDIGLNNNEIKIYLDLLSNPKSSILEISKRTMLYRSNIYETISTLESKTIITRNIGSEKKVYSAIDPEGLLDYLEEKEKNIEDIIPMLKSIRSEYESDDFTEVYKGRFNISEVLEKNKNNNKEILILNPACLEKNNMEFDIIKDLNKIKEKLGLKIRVIFSCNSKNVLEIKNINGVKVRVLKNCEKCEDSKCLKIAIGNSLSILVYQDSITVIQINNKSVTDCFRKTFDLLWENSEG